MRIERLLSIIIIISKKEMVTAKELADIMEVSERTIYRDIDRICEAGIPIASMGGKGGGYYLMEGYSMDNVYLNKNEMKPLLAVLENLTSLFGSGSRFKNILLKMDDLKDNKTSEDSFYINMGNGSRDKELKEFLSMADRAIEESRVMVFDYVNRKMECQQRVLEPVQIYFSDGQWYIFGFSRERNDYRNFKAIRIKNMSLGDKFPKRELTNDEIDEIMDRSYEKTSIQVELKFSERIGGHLPGYFHRDMIHKNPDGGYIVKNSYPDDEGLIKFILSFGRDCEVIKPLDLREKIKKYIEDMKNSYNH